MAVATAAILGPAAIAAGTSLISGLLGAKAQAEQERRNRILQSIQEEARQKQAAQQQLATQTQQVLGQGLAGFGSALR